MKIIGLQKLTLLDFPGHTACTVFTPGCNLRCPFCHNGGVVIPDRDTQYYTEDEIFAFLKKRAGVLDGVAVTGGEPLLQPDIGEFLKKVRELGYKVKLDTNGAYPERLRALLEAGLVDYVAMDIKNSKEKYPVTAGIDDLDVEPFIESIGIIKTLAPDYEFRTTVVAEFHETADIKAAAEMMGKVKAYYLQSYKESDNMLLGGCSAVSEETLFEMAETAGKITETCRVRGV